MEAISKERSWQQFIIILRRLLSMVLNRSDCGSQHASSPLRDLTESQLQNFNSDGG